jgi:hypothetical protein
MSNDNQANQIPQGCCGNTGETFDCAAMMKQFMACCENMTREQDSDCCADMLKACCGTTGSESDE